MSKRGCVSLVLVAVVVGLTGLVAVSQRAEVTTWTLPTADCLPEGIGITPSGKVFFAGEHGENICRTVRIANHIRQTAADILDKLFGTRPTCSIKMIFGTFQYSPTIPPAHHFLMNRVVSNIDPFNNCSVQAAPMKR